MHTFILLILSLALLIFTLGFISFLNGGGRLYAAIILPNHGGPSETIFLGVFRKKEKAESVIYQYNQDRGYLMNSEIIQCTVDKIPYSESP